MYKVSVTLECTIEHVFYSADDTRLMLFPAMILFTDLIGIVNFNNFNNCELANHSHWFNLGRPGWGEKSPLRLLDVDCAATIGM